MVWEDINANTKRNGFPIGQNDIARSHRYGPRRHLRVKRIPLTNAIHFLTREM